MDDFSEHTLTQWCELYSRLILDDAHHLGQLIASCSNQNFQRYLCTKDTVNDILSQGITTNDDYLKRLRLFNPIRTTL
ncbi:hypothetical protein [Methylocucumis oryzae]|uniref:Uncharacterized protein n=1 Tax=Methylocucumis oryzae TaxID=1632867 RepID=A0A0F3IIW5_9GAMM|nr:hypothetical protein [Methylocucumis oryzae]KJV06676.1 hypothetical protein VZ94_09745 [Methylocucumis oryzae]